jgi:hypothetical protein
VLALWGYRDDTAFAVWVFIALADVSAEYVCNVFIEHLAFIFFSGLQNLCSVKHGVAVSFVEEKI